MIILIIIQTLILIGFIFFGWRMKGGTEFLLGKFVDQVQKLTTESNAATKAFANEIKELKNLTKTVQDFKEEGKTFQNANKTLVITSQTLNNEGVRNYKSIDSSVRRLDVATKNLELITRNINAKLK